MSKNDYVMNMSNKTKADCDDEYTAFFCTTIKPLAYLKDCYDYMAEHTDTNQNCVVKVGKKPIDRYWKPNAFETCHPKKITKIRRHN